MWITSDWYPQILTDRFYRIYNNRKFIKRMNKDLKRRGRI